MKQMCNVRSVTGSDEPTESVEFPLALLRCIEFQLIV